MSENIWEWWGKYESTSHRPTGAPVELTPGVPMVDYFQRQPNLAAYPVEARPYILAAYEHWTRLWRPTLNAAKDETGQLIAARMVSSAWRIFLGRCVRVNDLLDGVPPDVLAIFPSTRRDPHWWMTEDGYKQALDWFEQGKFVEGM